MSESDSPPMPALAIIGIGCLFPGSTSAPAFWARVASGTDAIRPVPSTHWRAEDYLDPDPRSPDKVYAARGAFLEAYPFPPGDFGIPPNDLEATDASQLLGLVAARQALEDCGYTIGDGPRCIPRGRIGVILGVTGTLQLVIPLGARLGHPLWKKALREAGVDQATADDVCARIADGYVPWQENSFPGLLGNVVAGRIANRLDLGGTNCVVDAACASSLGAVHLAALELATGRADVVLTGGTDTFNDIFMFTCFSKTPALSPTGDARPFDAEGDGTILGEGLGMVVLKRLDDARRDGDRIYAVLRGIGSSSDGKGGAIYAPRKEGQTEALRNAYRAAGVTPATVELVEAHGTGTRVGDAAEVSALAEVYASAGRKGTWCAVGSIKSQIGHTKAAAGAAGLIKAALALHHKTLPPTIKIRKPLAPLMPGSGPLYANTACRPWMPSSHPRRAAVSAFGFGGSNFHAVLEEEGTDPPGIAWVEDVELIALSGDSRQAVEQQIDGERRPFDAGAAWRLVMLGEQREAARKALRDGVSTDEVFVGQGEPAGKLAVLFPGQGSQQTGMLRDLTCHFPPAFATFRAAHQAFGDLAGLVYPQPAWDAEGRARQEESLRATEAAQPALGAVCLGAWRILEHFGVRADAFAGHSYGELPALTAAGRLDEAALWRLSILRGKLMSSGSSGSMLAVKATPQRIREVLAEERLALVLANLNAPEQVVLSGDEPSIARAAEAFSRRKIPSTRLAVAAAFHSPAVAAAEGPLRAALGEVAFSPGTGVVFANSTAAPYPAEAEAARDLLAGQLARPVEWVRQMQAMHAHGVRSFIEAGPGSRLCGLVTATLPDVECRGIEGGFRGLARLLAWLAARGHRVRLDLWNPRNPSPRRSSLTVPLSGANHVRPRPARPPRAPDRNETPKHTMTTPQPQPQPQPQPLTPALDPAPLGQALALTRESLATLQRMQEQSSALHRQFLDGQDAAARTMAQLIETQQRLLAASLGHPTPSLPAPPARWQPPLPATPARPAPLPVAALPPQPPPPRAPIPQAHVPHPASPAPTRQANVPPPARSTGGVSEILLGVIAEKTGYPPEMLGMEMALDADLGIDSIKRVEILSALQERLPDAPPVKPEHLGTLHTLADIAAFLTGPAEVAHTRPTEPVPSPAPGLERSILEVRPLSGRAPRPLAGEVWIGSDDPDLASLLPGTRIPVADMAHADAPPSLAALVLIAPPGPLEDAFLRDALFAVQTAGPALRAGRGMLLTVSRLDGAFGLSGSAPTREPIDAALAGLAKTTGLEWPQIAVRALDISPDLPPEEAARAIESEMRLEGPVEVGISAAGAVSLERVPAPAAATTFVPFRPGDLVVISGGARGVTAEAAFALAQQFRPVLLLLGRSPEPGPEPDWLAGLADESAIKRELARRATGQTPRQIGEQTRALLSQREVRENLARLRQAGARTIYRSVDVRDAGAVAAAIGEARQQHGPVRGVIHGAGVLADARIEDKTPAQFDAVWGAKVEGLRALLAACGDDELRAVALFSSSTARFGRVGQVDYAMANEALNKMAWAISRTRPSCRAVALGWGPWDGGMVTPGLRSLFASEGVGVIPLRDGARLLAEELRIGPAGPSETVVLATTQPSSAATHEPTGNTAPAPLSVAFERIASVEQMPILQEHLLGGKPVVPFALMLEWLAHAALVQNTGFVFHGADDLRVLRGIVLDGEPLSLRFGSGKAARRDGLHAAPAEIRSTRGGKEILHARADILLANSLPRAPEATTAPFLPAYPLSPADAYRRRLLFHGPGLHAISAVEGLGEPGARARLNAAPPPIQWLRQPLRQLWLTDPLAIDGCFQLAILWSRAQRGAASLPCRIRRYRQYTKSYPAAGAQALLLVERASATTAVADLELTDPEGGVVARAEGYECTLDPSLDRAFACA